MTTTTATATTTAHRRNSAALCAARGPRSGDETAATTITNMVYDVGMSDESRKGLLLENEVLAVDGHCSR
ncbi:MAG: hypothetical protein R2932_43090 [Caldilineaceae bacterium]